MSGEATERSKAEQEDTRARGPLQRILLILTITAFLVAAGTGIYGVYNFPDAPIRQTAEGYRGKGGKAHTLDEFEKFVVWKRTMFVTFPSAFLFGFAFAIADGRLRKH